MAAPLRIFSPQASAPEISPRISLGQFFRGCFEPLWISARGLSPATAASYRESIAWWQRLTGDPPLGEIDDWVAAEFVGGLQRQTGRRNRALSPFTISKHTRQLQRVLDFAGPKTRDRHGRRNLAVVPDVPLLEHPRLPLLAPDGDFALGEIRAAYLAAAWMTRPTTLAWPPGWWRALVVVAATTGLRVGQLLSLQWQDLQPAEGLPGAWVLVTHQAHRARRGLRQYLTAEAVAHLEQNRQHPRQLFPWTASRRWLGASLQQLLELAGLPPQRRFGFHGFRKYLTTALRRSGFASSQRLAQAAAGHADVRTTSAHYINASLEELLLAEALEALPKIRRG